MPFRHEYCLLEVARSHSYSINGYSDVSVYS